MNAEEDKEKSKAGKRWGGWDKEEYFQRMLRHYFYYWWNPGGIDKKSIQHCAFYVWQFFHGWLLVQVCKLLREGGNT